MTSNRKAVAFAGLAIAALSGGCAAALGNGDPRGNGGLIELGHAF